jgi:MFS family permease
MGLFVSAPLGGWLGSQISWEFPMQLTCIPILISCVFAGLLPEPSRMKQEKESIFISLKKGIGYLAHHAELRPLVIDAVTVAAAAYFVLWLYQPLLLKYGIGGELLSLFYILMLAAEIIVSTLNTWIAKKIGFMRFRILTSILVAVGFLIATLGGVISIYVFLVLTGGIGLTRFMFMCSYMQEHIPEENRATIGSTIQVARQMLIAVLNPIMGWLFIQSNSITMIALALIALMPVWIMIGRRSR